MFQNCRGQLGVTNKIAGGGPAAGHFLLYGQKKVTKENAALIRRPCGLPCVAQRNGRLRNSPLPLRGKSSNSARRLPPFRLRYSEAHKGVGEVARDTKSPCEPPSSTARSGDVGEDCLSPCRAAARASCAPRRKSPWVAAARPGEQRRSCLSPALAARALGWKPTVSLAEGLRRTFGFFKKEIAP